MSAFQKILHKFESVMSQPKSKIRIGISFASNQKEKAVFAGLSAY
jgi:hypothetical protein